MTPAIYVLARPNFTREFEKFLSAEGLQWNQRDASAAERLIEFAGRICYMSFGPRQSPRTNSEYIANLIRQGHGSVLEHANWTFLLSGVTRAFTHQLVRHRAGFSFSQLSQQYHDETDATFVTPAGLDHHPAALEAWHDAVSATRRAYRAILNALNSEENESRAGNKKESIRAIHSAARSVLPNATETKIVVTANARALRHFITVRGSLEGDYEMRAVSRLIYELLRSDAPALASDFELRSMADGTPIVFTRNHSELVS
jgi:thymidylate synthase (FAD)